MGHKSVLATIHEYPECHKTSGWNISINLPYHDYHFPNGFIDVMQHPDIVSWSPKNRQIVFLELTMPCEKQIAQSC